MLDYPSLDGFENVYLEDSFVLGITASPARLALELDLVLTPGHPAYTTPVPGEQHCYVKATIEFLNVRRLEWTEQGTPPAVDASGSVDYGGVDALHWNGAAFHLEGDWGKADVESSLPVIQLHN
ncbi:hypothetical protein AB0436_08525 [Streptomyces sp. NPDC051322]|uniref:hypothetical protein n=1 Tax=Streptomyces sp. NPDC051322 TaxID=3154645 RepID=UPI00345057ED